MQLIGPLKNKDAYPLEALQNELVMRERFWQGQRTKEEELLKDLSAIALYVLDVAREGKIHKIKLKERIALMDELCQSLEEDSLREVQRRACSNLNSLLIKMCQLPIGEGNTEEKEQQQIFSLVIKKTTEKLMEFAKKIEQESERQISQLREWMKSREQASEAVVKARQTTIMMKYIDEFEDHIKKTLSGVDSAYCRLEYMREQNKIQGLLAKSYLLGTSPHYTNLQRSYWDVSRKDHRHIGQMLIPMLKHLMEAMEGSKKSTSLTERQPPVSGMPTTPMFPDSNPTPAAAANLICIDQI
ncbi:uncharacterized protein [Aquarana catesbeiana]|uniref:uncharacterized protein n=1 Tax=Aquarana catesbeiana TaxID=8400 RepID=UPI003CC9542D